MEKFHRDVLQACQVEFCDDLDVLPVMDHLRADNILTIDDTERLKDQGTSMGRRRYLLDILPSKGPRAYSKFREVLSVVQPHLRTVLRHKEEELQTKGCELHKYFSLFLLYSCFRAMPFAVDILHFDIGNGKHNRNITYFDPYMQKRVSF